MAYVHTEWFHMVYVNGQMLPACVVCGEVAPDSPQDHIETHPEFALAEADI